MKKFIALFLCMALCLSPTVFAAESEETAAADELIAFPGAEGGGMYTTGARAASKPEIYRVNNFGDSGTGSFRDAVSKENRIIVFDEAGEIKLKSPINISKKNLTILGQTAPGDGICISGAPVKVSADNIIMRYLRFRMGVYSEVDKKYDDDALGGTSSTSNLIVDHCSMSWSTDECCSFYAIKDSTIQWCIMTEPLNRSIHDEGSGIEAHGYGGIWGGVNVSYHHNMVSSANNRFPRVGTSETVSSYKGGKDTESLLDIRNNVFYNWNGNNSYGGENGVRVNLVSNYYKEGPASSSVNRFYEMYGGSKGGKSKWGTDIAVDGNYYASKNSQSSTVRAINEDNTKGVDTRDCKTYNIEKYDETIAGTTTNHTQYIREYPIGTHSAEEAFNLVLEHAGDSLKRDAVDERAVNDARNGTAEMGNNGIIDLAHLKKMPDITYSSGTVPNDTDGDGMADEYEKDHGLDINKNDALGKTSEGYFNIEAYANWLAEGNELEIPPTPTLDPNQPTPTPSPTPTPTPIPRHNITVDENMQNGSIEINGVSSRTITWNAAEHKSEIDGEKTLNLNGSEGSDGTITMYDPTTAAFEFGGRTSAKGENNPSAKPPFTDSNKPSGSVYMIKPAVDGEMKISFYVYGGKELNIYDNAAKKYIVQRNQKPTEGYYEHTFECYAGREIYAWADGSKIGVESVTVTGGGGASAKVGETVNITTVPSSGFKAHGIYTTPKTETRMLAENSFSFVMPDSDVVVGAEFKDESLPLPTPEPTAAPTDTPEPTAAVTDTPGPTAAPTGTPEPSAKPTAAPQPTESPTVTEKPGETPAPTSEAKPDHLYEIAGCEFGDDGKINIDLKYNGNGSDRAKLIIASYGKGGTLTDTKMYDITGSDISAVDYKKPESGSIKIYIWNFETLSPMAEAYEKQI